MADPVCYINTFKDDLLVKIFDITSNWPFSGPLRREQILLNQIGLVSRRWKELASSPQLWRRFDRFFDRPNSFSPQFRSFFDRIAPTIEILQVSIDFNMFPAGLLELPQLPNVTRLSVNFSPDIITPADAQSIVQFCPNVTSVKFDCFHLNEENLQIFAAGWKEKLVEADFSQNEEVTGVGLIRFVSIANKLKTIDLSLTDYLTASDFNLITGVLRNSLKSISFGAGGDLLYNEENLSGSHIQAISGNCPQLEEIHIYQPMYFGHLKDLTNLRRLTVTTMDDDMIVDFEVNEGLADSFCRPFAHLRYLKIQGGRNVSDSLLSLIANGCPVIETLKIFCHCQVNLDATDAGLDEIVDKCRCLTSLYLSGFPHVTGLSFIGVREKLPRLRVLHFWDCQNVDMDALKAEFGGVKGMKILSSRGSRNFPDNLEIFNT